MPNKDLSSQSEGMDSDLKDESHTSKASENSEKHNCSLSD